MNSKMCDERTDPIIHRPHPLQTRAVILGVDHKVCVQFRQSVKDLLKMLNGRLLFGIASVDVVVCVGYLTTTTTTTASGLLSKRAQQRQGEDERRSESGDERGSKRDAPDAALGGERRDELEIADGAGGIAVHAAYCGSVESKLAFLRRVDAMRRAPGKLHPVDPAETAPGGCDAYDRRKFFQCGHAPWDGDC